MQGVFGHPMKLSKIKQYTKFLLLLSKCLRSVLQWSKTESTTVLKNVTSSFFRASFMGLSARWLVRCCVLSIIMATCAVSDYWSLFFSLLPRADLMLYARLLAAICAFAENAYLCVKCGLPWIVGHYAGESSVQVDVYPQGDDAMSFLSLPLSLC